MDRLLKRKAREGVKIYIVVYKEVSLALTLDSAHTKKWLQDLHPNIQGKEAVVIYLFAVEFFFLKCRIGRTKRC